MSDEERAKEIQPADLLRHLYPNLGDAESAEAAESFDRYIALMLRIYDRIQTDPNELAKFRALTAVENSSIIEAPQSGSHKPAD